MTPRQIKISKYLSLVLRHDPAAGGIVLDAEGWASIDDLLRAVTDKKLTFDRDELLAVVADNDKQRFAVSNDGQRIRASQGHSVQVDLQYAPQIPPETLFHGTAEKAVESIRSQGLTKRQRRHVHLSADRDTAVKVGTRHGSPVVFQISAGQMHREGFKFFLSDNGVWLTDTVPAIYLSLEGHESSND